MPKPEPLGPWRKAVLDRDDRRCQMGWSGCHGPLAAHHVILQSRDPSRRADVDNGATLCLHHHSWVHANPADATKIGLMGHRRDTVKDGRVIPEPDIAA